MKLYLIALICLLGTFFQQLIAQPLSLRHCIEKGLQNNYSLRIVRNQQSIADENATRANAGYLPTVEARGGYDVSLDSRNSKAGGSVIRDRRMVGQSASVGIFAEWTVFDGYKIQTNWARLNELKRQSAIQTRMAIEDYVADVAAEYYNFVQQLIRMRNLRYAVSLSKERLRIVQERYIIGDNSRLDLQQAQVDFNADSAQSLKQLELLATSRIRLNELMAEREVNSKLVVEDTLINVSSSLSFDSLWAATLRTNASLINAAHNRTLADLDFKQVASRDFPYVRLNGNYGYTFDQTRGNNTTRRHGWGGDVGVTVGMRLFDGNRRRERTVARLKMDNAEQAEQELKLALKADLADLWQAYENNLRLLALEKQNLVNAQENHFIACERYMLGDLSGIEMREAQKSLLDAEERILVAEYNTKLCEISLLQLSGGILRYFVE